MLVDKHHAILLHDIMMSCHPCLFISIGWCVRPILLRNGFFFMCKNFRTHMCSLWLSVGCCCGGIFRVQSSPSRVLLETGARWKLRLPLLSSWLRSPSVSPSSLSCEKYIDYYNIVIVICMLFFIMIFSTLGCLLCSDCCRNLLCFQYVFRQQPVLLQCMVSHFHAVCVYRMARKECFFYAPWRRRFIFDIFQ